MIVAYWYKIGSKGSPEESKKKKDDAVKAATSFMEVGAGSAAAAPDPCKIEKGAPLKCMQERYWQQIFAANGISNLPAVPEPPDHPDAPAAYPDPLSSNYPIPPPPPHPYDPRDNGPSAMLPGNAGVVDEGALASFLEMEESLELRTEHRAMVMHMQELGLHQHAELAMTHGMGNIFATNDLWMFNGATLAWEQVAPMPGPIPAPRWLHASAMIGNSLFIFGGFTSNLMMDFWHLEIGMYNTHSCFQQALAQLINRRFL